MHAPRPLQSFEGGVSLRATTARQVRQGVLALQRTCQTSCYGDNIGTGWLSGPVRSVQAAGGGTSKGARVALTTSVSNISPDLTLATRTEHPQLTDPGESHLKWTLSVALRDQRY